MRRPDFTRDVRCVMGLPFDAVTEAQAEAILRGAAASGRRCFLSTPNLNIACACLSDPELRQSVICSDLSIADGMPIVALGRLTGADLPERVAGSSLFERLMRAAPQHRLTVYFFGGEDGMAARAQEALARAGSAVQCVGHESPGFGSVEDMSRAETMARINASGADMLVVAIGARKGQAWLLRNLERLRPPVLAYLGAVINFVAGSVRRAPRWAQRLHLEWLWRILQEPSLWQRYWNDGSLLVRTFFGQSLPLALHLRRHAPTDADLAAARLGVEPGPDACLLRLEGAWVRGNAQPLRDALTRAVAEGQTPRFDLGATAHLDMAVVGLLILAAGVRPQPVVRCSAGAGRILQWAGAGYLLAPGAQVDGPVVATAAPETTR